MLKSSENSRNETLKEVYQSEDISDSGVSSDKTDADVNILTFKKCITTIYIFHTLFYVQYYFIFLAFP